MTAAREGTCAACVRPVAPDAAFCGWCGATLSRVCRSCGRPNAPSHRFCDGCGTQFTGDDEVPKRRIEPDDGGRRHLTVMFVDLVGSTLLSGRLDPEDMRRVVRAYQARCVEVITPYDGFVANYQGDAVIAYFGFPAAHEDDARQAVRAARHVVAAIPELAAELGVGGLAARVGVHTGLVVVGEMGAGAARLGLDVIGEAPNVAARLQGLAEPNQVVISGSTQALVEGFFTFDSLGTPALKGVDRPLPAYVVLDETDAQTRLDAVGRRGLTPLVGRDAELGQLLATWQAARDGTGRLVVISGEPGIGKSRLVHELHRRVEDDGGAVIELRGSPHSHNSALQPVIDHIRRATGLAHAPSHADGVRRIEAMVRHSRQPPADAVAVIGELLDVETGAPQHHMPLGPEARRRRTLEVLNALLLGLADERAALLVCEDVQWFDPTTIDLLADVFHRDLPDRLLTVITTRSDHPLPWPALGDPVNLSLTRLLTPEVDRIVAQLCGSRELPDDLLRQIADRTDGVPLFVEELTQMLLDTPAERSVAVARSGRSVPSTLRELLMARLDRQGSAADVAQLAATVGREVSDEFLRAIWTGPPETLAAELERLVSSGLMLRGGEGAMAIYSFKHALVQDVAYDSLLKTVRHAHHRTIAEALEARQDGVSPVSPEVIAQHFTSADLPARAVPYWLLAGDRALEQSADREAIGHLTTGLELLAQLPEGRRRDEQELALLVRLGAPLMATRGYGSSDVEDVYRRALALGDGLGDMTQLFEALYGIFRMHLLRAEYSVALDVADRLVALAELADRPECQVAACRAVGSVLVYYGDDKAEALRVLQRAIATDAASGGQRRRAPALNDVADAAVTSRAYAAWALWLQGRTEEADAMSVKAIDAARHLGHPFTLALALSFDLWLRQFENDVDAVRSRAEEVHHFAVEQGFTFWIGWASIMRGWARGASGDPVGGAAEIRQGLVDWQATGSELGLTYFLALLADTLRRAGETEAALEILREASTIAVENDEAFWQPELHRLRAELLAATGDHGGAASALSQAMTTATRQGAAALAARAAATQQRLATA